MMKLILPFLIYLITNSALAVTKHEIEIIKFKFSPAEITIEAGDTIRWTNKEKRQYHSVWFEQLGEPEPGYFFPDEFFERTFDKVGDFPYRCGPHPKMTGMVHVSSNNQSSDSNQTKTPRSSEGLDQSTKETEDKTTQYNAIEDNSKAEVNNIKPQVSTTEQKKTDHNKSNNISLDRKKEILHLLKHDCGSCHGMTLKGGLGPTLKPTALEKLTEEQVAFTITHGRPGTPMPPWESFFNQKEILWLAQQLKQGIKDPIKIPMTNREPHK